MIFLRKVPKICLRGIAKPYFPTLIDFSISFLDEFLSINLNSNFNEYLEIIATEKDKNSILSKLALIELYTKTVDTLAQITSADTKSNQRDASRT